MSFQLPANMPSLNLHVPTHRSRSSSIELNEKLLQHWITQLPKTNLLQFVALYLEALQRFNNNVIDAKQRLLLLDIYREPVNKLLFELTLHKLPQKLPNSKERLQFIHDLGEVMAQLATGYKIVVLDAGEMNSKLPNNPLGQIAINRAIEQLSLLAVHAYKFYRTVPEHVFRELHQLFMLTLHHDVDDELIMMSKQLQTSISTRTRYIQMMLLTICNPYGLQDGEVLKVLATMQQLANVTEVTLYSKDSQTTAGYFHINCVSDRIPHPAVIPASDEQDATPTLLLNTKPTLTLADNVFQRAERQRVDVYAGIDINQLKQLIPYLNTSYQRKQARTSVSGNTRTFIAVGLAKIHQSLTEVTALPDEKLPWLNKAWDILNKNSYGYLVSRYDVSGAHDLKIGDFVGIIESPEQGNRPTGKLASIRWLRTDNHGLTKMGLKFIDGDPRPVHYTVANSEQRLPAFLLPEISRINQPSTLITTTKTFQPARVIDIKTGKKRFDFSIEMETLVESNLNFERFTFKEKFD